MINKASSTFKFRRHAPLTDRMAEIIRLEVLRGINAYYEVLRERVPVYTGRLRMSFQPLGEALANEGVRRNTGVGDISGKIKQTNVYQNVGGRQINLDMENNKSYRNWTRVRVPKKAQKGQYTFTFSSQSPYYGVNDSTSVERVRSTPWHSIPAAQAALRERVVERLPKVVKGIILNDFKEVCNVDVSTDPMSPLAYKLPGNVLRLLGAYDE